LPAQKASVGKALVGIRTDALAFVIVMISSVLSQAAANGPEGPPLCRRVTRTPAGRPSPANRSSLGKLCSIKIAIELGTPALMCPTKTTGAARGRVDLD
jgi:hypothetical protein